MLTGQTWASSSSSVDTVLPIINKIDNEMISDHSISSGDIKGVNDKIAEHN